MPKIIKEKKIINGRYLIFFEFCDNSIRVVKQPPLPRGVELAQYESVEEGDIVGLEMYCRSQANKEGYSTCEFSMEDLEKAENENEGFGVKMGEYMGRLTIGPLSKKSKK